MKKDEEIAEYLANKGESFSDELHHENHYFFATLKDSYFSIASSIALCWTGHAVYEGEFIEYASSFIDGTIAKDPKIATKFCKRFGVDQLDKALTGYRAFYRRVKHLMPDFEVCSVQDINKLQNNLLNKLHELRSTGEISGIGPWLFLGPFKILLSDQRRLWEHEGINAIILPTGIEVNKGIVRLKNENYRFMKDFDLNWLEETTSSLLDNYATCNMVHTHINKISMLSNTSAIHINSALYQYGRNEI